MRFTTLTGVVALHVCLACHAVESAHADPTDSNPLISESTLPFHYPAFDKIRTEHFRPAIEQGMREHLAEVQAIATNPARPTFDNTIVALERSGRLLKRARTTFENLNATLTNPDMQALQRSLAPTLAEHDDAVLLNGELYGRIAMLNAERGRMALDEESDRLVWRYYQDFVRAGARLSDADQALLRVLNTELASLETAFEQNVLKEREANSVWFDTREDLAGLSSAEIQAAAEAATKAGQDGKYKLALVNTSGQPVLSYLLQHASRSKVLAASLSRGFEGGPWDNTALV